MKYLRDVIVRKRPLPSSADQPHREEEETVSDFFDFDAMRAKLAEPQESADLVPATRAEPLRETARMTAPDRPSVAAPAAPTKQIWDLEDSDPQDAAAAPPQRPAPRPAVAEAPAARSRLDREVAPEPARPAAGRVKTRIIGFHAGNPENDVFAAEKAAPAAAGQFPAGWLVVVDGPGRGASFSIAAGVSTIGRGADQTVCLDFGDTSVSRENHASVAYDEEQNRFFVGHGGKSNIVRRNGNPVLVTEELADADLIRIGKTTLRFVALCGPDFTWGSPDDGQDSDAADR